MRPNTLAEAIERILAGTPQDNALPEFVDSFYLAPTPSGNTPASRRSRRTRTIRG